MSTGIVKWFNSAKGYGFITPDEGSQDLFVHYSNILSDGYRNLEQGQRVNYEYCEGPKGPHAGEVSLTGVSTNHEASSNAEPKQESTEVA